MKNVKIDLKGHRQRLRERFASSEPGSRSEADYTLPTNLIAENHLWEIRE